jgi:hypothetical protein
MLSIGIKNNQYGSKIRGKNCISRRVKWLKGDRGCISKIYVLTMSKYVPAALLYIAHTLSRLVSCHKCMELACGVLPGHFGPIYLLQVSKNDDEEHYFLK